MPKVASLDGQVRRYLADHPGSDAAPILKDILNILDQNHLHTVATEFTSRNSDEISILNRLVDILSPRLCASCQNRIRSVIVENSEENI